jgi:vacuolar-type H+-ATPase subunit I/STV1
MTTLTTEGRVHLAKCPKCGTETAAPIKTWPIPSRKPTKEGESCFVVGIFECPNCKARFRTAIEAQPTKKEETVSIKSMVERIKGIQGELVQTLRNLREKIKTLETERASLMSEIENLRKVAEARINALESEVNILRDDVKSLRDILGYAQETEE